jgi:O-acetyl-ADP-ribose deacetylase (regulator of RNase III)
MSTSDTTRENARKEAKNNPLENAKTLRGIYKSDKDYAFPAWVLDPDRWSDSDGEKSHKFDETIVVYDNENELPKVKELVEQREPVNIAMNQNYDENKLETNFGWKTGAYSKSSNLYLYPNIGIYCHARVTNEEKTDEKDVHVMNLIGYAFDSVKQPDYIYFMHTYGHNKSNLTTLDAENKKDLKLQLIQRYRKIWLKACYICKLKGLENLWYYGVGSGFFSELLPNEYNKASGNFYQEIFAPAFGIDPTDSKKLHSTNNDENDLTIPINFCKKYGIKVQNLGSSSSKFIPDVLFTTDTTPTDTLYINAWDPWSIIGNGNAADDSLDGNWGRNSNMSVLGWSMTNSKLLPDITGGASAEPSKILSMKQILAKIEAKDAAGKAPDSSGSTPPTPRCKINSKTQSITDISVECQDAIFSFVAKPVISSPPSDEPTEMSNLVSAIGTDYSTKYADEDIMPAGSATLLYIGDTELYDVKPPSTTNKTSVKIKYMIQASPAKAGYESDVSRDITKDTISNSVMNSLILAAKNDVETIIFPFIGGQIFFNTLKEKVDNENKSVTGYIPYDTDQHAEVLVKGVTDFYKNLSSYGISANPIKEIYFVTYNAPEEKKDPNDKNKVTKPAGPLENEAIEKAYSKAIISNGLLKSVLKPSTKGNVISNAIFYSDPSRNKPNIAIVNAANTQLEFGSGVSNMCYAGLTGNLSATTSDKDKSTYQIKLNSIKTKFIEAFKVYIADPSSASPSTATPPVVKKPFAGVIKDLEGQLTDASENDTEIKKLGITLPTDFLYPTDGDASVVKKNLNSDEPTIEKMVTAFANATTDDATKITRDFYLGACRSIEAAYKLDETEAGVDDNKKIRAKLLLNLRKNSLLLKVPWLWDYKEMKMGVEVEPALTLDEVKVEYDRLQQECKDLTGGYESEAAYKLAEQLIPLNEKMEIGVLEEKNKIVQKDYPSEEFVYAPSIKITPGYTKIVTQENLNCGRAALANFFGVPDLLVKGDPSKTEEVFNLNIARPDTKINMGSICNLRAKYAKLFNNYDKLSDECPDGENYSINVLGVVLQILGYQSGEHIVFSGNPAEASDDNHNEANKTASDENTLGYLVNINKGHWICYKKVSFNKSEDSFYRINSTKETDEDAVSKNTYSIKQLIDMDGGNNTSLYLSIYPITILTSPATNQSLFNSFSGASSRDFYKNQIKDNETNYQWKLFIKEIVSKIITDVKSYESEENRIKIMAYFSNMPTDIITNDEKKKILDSCKNPSTKNQIIDKFIEMLQEYMTNDDFANFKTESTKDKTYIEKGGSYKPTDIAEKRFFYNLNNSTSYNNETFKPKYQKQTFLLSVYAIIKIANDALASLASPGGGGFKPRHNAITNHAKSKHNSSFKASSSSKSKGKSHSRSHTQRVK